MKDTKVDLYKMDFFGYIPYRPDKKINVGEMLSYFTGNLHYTDLILCAEDYSPQVIKFGDLLIGFTDVPEILQCVPVDAHWAQLKDMETIIITEEEINREASESAIPTPKYAARSAAKKLLEKELREHKKDIGTYFTDNGNLAAYVLPYPYSRVFIGKNIFGYTELMSSFHDREITADDIE